MDSPGSSELAPSVRRRFHPKFTLDIETAISKLKEKAERDQEKKEQVLGCVDPSSVINAWYFATYERAEVHRSMVNDSVRTGTFAMAVGRNHHLFKDKIVLDVGTGSGVLSILCVKEAGARHVYAVDASAFVHEAELLIRSNKLEDKITVIHKRVEDLDALPDETKEVDIIVSEWMGHGLFKESMLDSVIIARKRFLRSGGYILPDTCVLRVSGSSSARYPAVTRANGEKLHNFMKGVVRNLDLSLLLHEDVSFTTNRTVSPEKIITGFAELKTVDMYYVQREDVKVDSAFSITARGHGTFRSFVFHFDALFDLPNGWCFSTGPDSRPTHWRQTVAALPAEEEFEVWRDTVVAGRIRMERIRALPRFWSIVIDYTVTWKKRPPLSRSRTFYLM